MYKHGGTGTRLYRIWKCMKTRCYNSNSPAYHNYGGRGIKVCDEWLSNFESFKNWSISNGYSDDLTIDRIENEGDYTPINCRWVDRLTQANNTRKNVTLTHDGKTLTLSEWSRELNIESSTITHRYRMGYSTPQILGYEKLNPNKKGYPVQQLTLAGDVIMDFDSIKEAVDITGVINVGACCRGVRKTAGGFKWRFLDG